MAPDIVDGPLDISASLKVIKGTPVTLMPEIRKQAQILKPDKTEKIKEPEDEWFLLRKDIKWGNVIWLTAFHLVAVYGFITYPFIQRWKTFLWGLFMGHVSAFGVTGGIHRFWTHRSYKANLPLKIFVSFCFLTAGQNSIYQWVRDHRVHHKFSETDADPHNSNRGFFFSHVGWLMLKKHPEVLRKGKLIDMSDIESDPVAAFCERHFRLLKIMACFVLPTVVPVYFWGEEWYYAIVIQMARYVFSLNATWSVNSFAHFFGNKPYDKNMAPAENKYVAYASFGEGWHNYHHAFPSDYRAAEIGGGRFNPATLLIDFFAKIGWASDLKTPPESLIKMTIDNRGDGSHVNSQKTDETMCGKTK